MTENWVTTAINDSTLVAELLLRLKQATATPPCAIPFKWGLRLPRSRPPATATKTTVSSVVVRKKENGCTRRCSPTTPLAWNGGCVGGAASPSRKSDGFDETSCHVTTTSVSVVRSKGVANAEATNTVTKRSRKKRTFAELKEEESTLLKERLYLNEQLESLRAVVKEQRIINDNLKRLTVDLSSRETQKATTVQLHSMETCSAYDVEHSSTSSRNPHLPSIEKQDLTSYESFLVPDLNMVPAE